MARDWHIVSVLDTDLLLAAQHPGLARLGIILCWVVIAYEHAEQYPDWRP